MGARRVWRPERVRVRGCGGATSAVDGSGGGAGEVVDVDVDVEVGSTEAAALSMPWMSRCRR